MCAKEDTEQERVADGKKPNRMLLWLVAAAFFMDMLDSTILNTAIPTMAVSFCQSPLRMQAVLIAYTLTIALLIPISGWLADRFGTRRIFFSSIIIFCGGSFCCAVSPTFHVLIASRILQGIGGAMMVPVGRLIVVKAYPKRQLVQAMNFVILPALIGPLIGPTVGGLIVTYTTWHWIFFINLPIGFAVGCMVLPLLPNFREPSVPPFDWFGAGLFGLSMVCILFSLEGITTLHLSRRIVLLCFVFGCLSLLSYWIYAFRTVNPLFPPTLFRYRGVTVGIIGGIFARLANGSIPFMTPLLLQIGLGFSPFKSGLTIIPLSLASLLSKSWVEYVLRKLGYRRMLITNTILLGALIMSLSVITEHTPYPLLLLHLLIFGFINAMQFTAMNTLVLLSLPRGEQSSGNSMLSVVIQVSISLGIATAALVLGMYSHLFHVSLIDHQHLIKRDTIIRVFQCTFLTIGLFAVVAASIFCWTPRSSEIRKQIENDV
jgi:EmrB/QacA subfamily drug resistance transporter